MTRSAAFDLARQRVRETGKPWLVTQPKRKGDRLPHMYDAESAYATVFRDIVAWISVNGSERVYDGLDAPERVGEETR